jgi:hypothetical protein
MTCGPGFSRGGRNGAELKKGRSGDEQTQHTFILRLRHVKHPVFVRRLISCRPESRPMVSTSKALRWDYSGIFVPLRWYLFMSPPAQGNARIVGHARGKRETHCIRIWEPVHVGGVDAVVAHVRGSGCRHCWARHVRSHRDPVLRLCLWLPVVEGSHARESSRVRPVRVGRD